MKSKGRFLLKRKIDDSIGFLLFRMLGRRKKKEFPEEVNTIVIFKLSAIGDSLLCLPMIKELKKTGARIVVVHSSDNKIVFENQPFIDETIVLDVSGRNPFKIVRALGKIRRIGDVAIDLSHTGNLSGVFSYISSRHLVGFFNPEVERRTGFYDFEVLLDLGNHMVNNYLSLLHLFNIEKPNNVRLIPLVVDKKNGNKLLKSTGYVGLHPCHEIIGKSWDEKKFAKVIDYLTEKGKIPVIFGSKKEKEKIEKLLELVKGKDKVIDLSGNSLEETYLLMKKMDFFIANDGGVMHMAASLGLPVLGIFNVDTPKRYAPYNLRSVGVGKEALSGEVIGILEERFL